MIQGNTFEEKYQSYFNYVSKPHTLEEIKEFITKNKIPTDAPFTTIHLNMIDTKNLNILFHIVTTSNSDNDCLQKLKLLIEEYEVNYTIFDFNFHRKLPFYTCIKGYLESTKYLIDKMNFNIDYLDEREQSLFFSAIRSYNLELVEYLDNKYPRWIYFPDNNNDSCIFNVFKKNMNDEENMKFKSVLKYLLKKGFNIDEKNNKNISFREKCNYFHKQEILQEVINEIEKEKNENLVKELNDINEINMNENNFDEEIQINKNEIVDTSNIIYTDNRNNSIINEKLSVNHDDKNDKENNFKELNDGLLKKPIVNDDKKKEIINEKINDEKEKLEDVCKDKIENFSNIIENNFHKNKEDNDLNNNYPVKLPDDNYKNEIKNKNDSNIIENGNVDNKTEINFLNFNKFQNNIENNIPIEKLEKKIGTSLEKDESDNINSNNEKNKMNSNNFTFDNESKEKSKYEISLNSIEQDNYIEKKQNEQESKNNDNEEKIECIYFNQKSNLVTDPEIILKLLTSNSILSKYLNKKRK